MPRIEVYRHSPITGPDAPESPTYLGDWERSRTDLRNPDDYLWVDLLGGSDYGGDSVNVANRKAFLAQFGAVDGVLDVYGGYGTYGVLIRRDVYDSNEELRDTLAGLDDYPVLDEEVMNEVEHEAENDAWESWACSDYQRALCVRFPESEEAIEDMDLDTCLHVFNTVADRENEYWINETGNSAYIDVDTIANATRLEDLALPIAPST